MKCYGYKRIGKGKVGFLENENKLDYFDVIMFGDRIYFLGIKKIFLYCDFCDDVLLNLIKKVVYLEECYFVMNFFRCSNCELIFLLKRKMKVYWYINYVERKYKCS